MKLNRRDLLRLGGLTALAPTLPLPSARAAEPLATVARPTNALDYTLHIATGLVELSPEHIVSTTLYNGQFPGPLIRLRESRRVVVDIHNETDTPELVHWHGQMVSSDVDGAAEEGTPYVPARGSRRISFIPRPAGLRFVHTHVRAGNDLNRGSARSSNSWLGKISREKSTIGSL